MDGPWPCSDCERLRRENDELKRRVAELESLAAAKERTGKRQAAPFSKGPPKAKPKPPGRKAGDQHGTHGHRPPPDPETVDETLDAPLPEACPHCGDVVDEDDEVDEQFQVDIPEKPVRRKFRIHKGTCRRCGRRVRGRHPLQTSDATGAAQSQFGPNAQAAVVYLNKKSGMSYGKIADVFGQLHGIDIQPSTATRIVLRAAGKLTPVYEEIQQSIATSPFITPDETGWRNGGRLVWLHAWVGDQATCYVIDPHRKADALENLIGRDYSGTLIRDGASTYDRFEDAIPQLCAAHAMRRARDLEETLDGRNALFPRQVIHLMQEALKRRDAFLLGPSSEDERAAAYEAFTARLYRLTASPRAHQANATFASHLHKYGHAWFSFLLEPHRPATNYQAEQALRTPIVNRKVFGGNRTDAGCHAQGILNSTIQTCAQQKRSPIAFLKDALCGFVRSILAPAPVTIAP